MMALWWTWVGAVASAAAPVVVHQTPAAEARAQVAQRTGLPEAQLRAVELDTLLDGHPAALGDVTLRHCAGAPARMDEIRAAQVRAENAWRTDDIQGALDLLDLGMSRLSCLTERVDPGVTARLFLLRGGLFARTGRPVIAVQELNSALALQPEARWDDRLPAEGQPILEGLKMDGSRATLALAPGATAGGPWIDGALPPTGTAEIALRPGLHLIQIASTAGLTSAWLTVEGDGALVVPRAYRRPVIERMADAA